MDATTPDSPLTPLPSLSPPSDTPRETFGMSMNDFEPDRSPVPLGADGVRRPDPTHRMFSALKKIVRALRLDGDPEHQLQTAILNGHDALFEWSWTQPHGEVIAQAAKDLDWILLNGDEPYKNTQTHQNDMAALARKDAAKAGAHRTQPSSQSGTRQPDTWVLARTWLSSGSPLDPDFRTPTGMGEVKVHQRDASPSVVNRKATEAVSQGALYLVAGCEGFGTWKCELYVNSKFGRLCAHEGQADGSGFPNITLLFESSELDGTVTTLSALMGHVRLIELLPHDLLKNGAWDQVVPPPEPLNFDTVHLMWQSQIGSLQLAAALPFNPPHHRLSPPSPGASAFLEQFAATCEFALDSEGLTAVANTKRKVPQANRAPGGIAPGGPSGRGGGGQGGGQPSGSGSAGTKASGRGVGENSRQRDGEGKGGAQPRRRGPARQTTQRPSSIRREQRSNARSYNVRPGSNGIEGRGDSVAPNVQIPRCMPRRVDADSKDSDCGGGCNPVAAQQAKLNNDSKDDTDPNRDNEENSHALETRKADEDEEEDDLEESDVCVKAAVVEWLLSIHDADRDPVPSLAALPFPSEREVPVYILSPAQMSTYQALRMEAVVDVSA